MKFQPVIKWIGSKRRQSEEITKRIEQKEYFSTIRDSYNKTSNPHDFMFIMRTTVNGMPRYNKNGKFNNTFHSTRNGIIPESLKEIIYQWSEKLNEKNVVFINTDYSTIQSCENDFIYLDPPYSATKGMYFGTIDYSNLWEWLRNQKANYILSFDGKTTYKDETYSVPLDLYSKHEYLNNGNSSMSRLVGKNKDSIVKESIYIK